MQKKRIRFTSTSVSYYFDAAMADLKKILARENAIIITDENIFDHHAANFKNWNTIVIKPGEEFKIQNTVDVVIEQLIEMQADRNTFLIGVGGGVITDLTGYIASIYMRGLAFGFVPTTLLAMVDASIGGKNGIDIGVFKNMAGTIRQPAFILYDIHFLKTLPAEEWQSGFAEIIKHACIKDAVMFKTLEHHNLKFYRRNKSALALLIQRNVLLKTKFVQMDEFEKAERKLLNFGHTLGHALENQYELSHGEAISIGMVYAAVLSQKLNSFKEPDRVIGLLAKFGLPTFASFDKEKVFRVLKMDKKRAQNMISFILLDQIGKASIRQLSMSEVYETI